MARCVPKKCVHNKASVRSSLGRADDSNHPVAGSTPAVDTRGKAERLGVRLPALFRSVFKNSQGVNVPVDEEGETIITSHFFIDSTVPSVGRGHRYANKGCQPS